MSKTCFLCLVAAISEHETWLTLRPSPFMSDTPRAAKMKAMNSPGGVTVAGDFAGLPTERLANDVLQTRGLRQKPNRTSETLKIN